MIMIISFFLVGAGLLGIGQLGNISRLVTDANKKTVTHITENSIREISKSVDHVIYGLFSIIAGMFLVILNSYLNRFFPH